MEQEGRIAKRQKLVNGSATRQQRASTASRVFVPYRTVGLVSPTAVPFTTVPLGKTTFQITTSVGRSLQTYDLRRGLNLVFVTRPQTPQIITASVAWKDKLLAAWGTDSVDGSRGVWVYRRGKKETELEFPSDAKEIVKAFCVFGSWIIGVCETQLMIWKSSTLELYTCLRGVSPIPFTKCITSLPTFLNKILVGRQDGSAEVWNVSSGKLVYTILPPSTSYGAVTAVEPTPALSLVAIAFESGPLVIHDIKTDRAVIQLSTTTGAPVTSISFRTDSLGAGDDGQKAGVMVSASNATGDITLWDLNNGGRRAGVLRAAHAQPSAKSLGGTSKVEFLAGQAILVSSGLDNSLKTWIFDESPFNSIPRILHERRGHAAPVSRLHFLPSASDGSDDTGKWLVSGSDDRSLWGWSLRRDGQSTEISQGAIQKKAKKQGLLSAGKEDSLEHLKCPPITAIACCLNRDGGIGAIPGKHPIWQPSGKGKQVSAETSAMTGWESILTAHANDSKARTWFWGRKRAGRWAFETGDGGNVTSVAMSPCGTFGAVGSEKGGIDLYNLQSGIHRQRFPARLTPMQAKQLRIDVEKNGLVEEDDGKKKIYRGQGKHAAAVVGIAIDSLNKTIVSAGADGKVKFWDFNTGMLQHEIDWAGVVRITSMRYHRHSDLAAFTCEDGCIRVIDVSSQRLIRELWPARKAVPELSDVRFSDFCFSSDGRWIAACAASCVLLWDLPTGHPIDAFKLRATCTSLAFSPTGEYLATATQDSLGVDIWTNRALFTYVPSRHISEKELVRVLQSTETQAPTVSGENSQNLLITEAGEEDEEDDSDLDFQTEDALGDLAEDLLSLSLVPRSQWQNLLHLDLIRQRNKPTDAPKKPEKAPFFLPSLQNGKPNTSEGTASSTALLDSTSAVKAAEELQKEQSRILTHSRLNQNQSTFTTLLLATSPESHDHDNEAIDSATQALFSHLSSLAPSAADVQIRSLASTELLPFILALTWLARHRRDFELVQAWMAVFLRVHGDILFTEDDEDEDEGSDKEDRSSTSIRSALEEWRAVTEEAVDATRKKAGYVRGLVGFLRAGRV
ncbi:Utp21-domain-containing protein [Dissoconium aciculare CBS 342.82]|uniref:Utp21-domain-containing protein n=1 Tax=Dissoconium aciculare CBS 342.82 TaxID=1314786 RepID=A0A6J3LYW9_9PEZI|nr:Utp21-domain-containing protein [Dissoconium aciculare CBS 342.82]KAF1820970.1 Utp21-domain-containing protein [Dissoconium aciculare CBS 342.82]